MMSLRCLSRSSRNVLKTSHISSPLQFESRCQYHQIKAHQIKILSSCLLRNRIQNSYFGISAARFLSTKNIEVESQDANVTQSYSQNIEKLAEAGPVPPMDKSNIGSPEIADIPTPIPEAPISKIEEILAELAKEPPIEDLGLGGWTPSGMVQQCLDYLHTGLDMPWWQAIMAATLCVRLLMFPLTIINQRNAIKLHNNLPEMTKLQMRMTEARQIGDNFEAARAGQELMTFMKKNEVNPLKNMMMPLVQAPVFMSFFMGLRGMANVPVDSMKEQGLFWFTDLTLPDQFYLLPVITSLTLLATIEIGAEGTPTGTGGMAKYSKYILRAIPVIIFPFSINFPGAICLYWSTSNFLSFIQVVVLKIPTVRVYFNLPEKIKHDTTTQVVQKGSGIVRDFKESMNNSKITREISERSQLDEMQFNKAGRAALVKTYKFNPTLQRAKSTDSSSQNVTGKK